MCIPVPAAHLLGCSYADKLIKALIGGTQQEKTQNKWACQDMANIIEFIYVSLNCDLTALWGNSGVRSEWRTCNTAKADQVLCHTAYLIDKYLHSENVILNDWFDNPLSF